jgi:O-antigen/teichoic acid export membrane protein
MLGKDGFGLYSFSFAYVSLFLFLTHLGINHLLVREVAKHKERASDFLGKTFPMVIILSIAFLLIVNIIPFILGWNNTESLITLAFSFYFIFDSFGHYFYGVIRAFERMEYQAIITVIERIFLMITALICWYLDFSLVTLVVLFTSVLGLKACISFLIVVKIFVRFSLSWSFYRVGPILKEAYPFALATLFATVSARIDLVMLKGFHSTEAVAIYSTARKIIESLTFIPENIYYAVFPALSLLYLTQKEKFNKTFKQTCIALTVIAVPITAGLFILAPRIIALLFEPEFSAAYIPLRWLSLVLLMIFIRHAFAVTLNATGDQHIFAIIFAIAMTVNLIMNFLLIPKYQGFGASIAAIASETSILVCSIPFVFKHVDFRWGKIFILKIIIVGAIISMVIFLIRDWHFIFIILIIVVVYSLLLILLKILTISDIREYTQIFIKKTLRESND